MVVFGLKLRENAFQTIPDISFFDAENIKLLQNFERPFTLQGWLRSASSFVKTRFRRSPAFHFSTAKSSKKINLLPNFERPLMAPFGLKLWENAFQMIPDISFFDVESEFSTKLFD